MDTNCKQGNLCYTKASVLLGLLNVKGEIAVFISGRGYVECKSSGVGSKVLLRGRYIGLSTNHSHTRRLASWTTRLLLHHHWLTHLLL